MAICNNVDFIFDYECVGDSLIKINTNFINLDTGLCQLGQELATLDAFIKSLSAKDSPTVDMSFSSNPYFLSADVVDNSLGTMKLGVDIPLTTKVFLTAAKISSLTDVDINNPIDGELLLWNGSKWVNQSVEDKVGAKILDELEDVTLTAPLNNGQVLKYNLALDQWVNAPEDTNYVLPDKDYGDITVSGNGQVWNIDAGAVGTTELATNAVTNTKIANEAVSNEKVERFTITRDRLAFDPGEKNDGANVGTGEAGIYAGKNGVTLQFKTLKAGSGIQLQATDTEITIKGATAAEPIAAKAQNVGTGAGLYKQVTGDSTLYFRTIKGGANINVSLDGDNIVISSPANLGLSVVGKKADGANISDTELLQIVQNIYPAANFSNGTECRIEVVYPEIASSGAISVTVPFEQRYYKSGANFWLLPATETNYPEGVPVNPATGKSKDGTFRFVQTLTGTGTTTQPPKISIPIGPSGKITRRCIITSGAWAITL